MWVSINSATTVETGTSALNDISDFPSMNILWFLDLQHEYGFRHGGTLRYTNFSRELLKLNHKVFYIVTNTSNVNRIERNKFLETLKNENCISGFFELEQSRGSSFRRKLRRLAIHPRIQNRILASALAGYKEKVYDLISRLSIDVCIISQRACLPLLPDLTQVSATIIDWCDSFVLVNIREARRRLKMGELTKVPSAVRAILAPLVEESFYSRCSTSNILVSQSDKKCMDVLNGRPQLNHVLQNGVTFPAATRNAVTKDANRLIFSGSMSFPPNYNGALWFIDHVMPTLILNNRAVKLIVAGQEPIPELLSKANEHIKITGLVPDIGAEIAKSQLYVAPLISGSGFRNKVIEAIASGTYVIGTPMALEFLDSRLQRTLLIAKTAEEFVTQIEGFLKNPRAFEGRLKEAVNIVRENYQWASRVKELEHLCHQAMELHVH